MKPLARFSDIHSHVRDDATRGDTIVSIFPADEMLPHGTYSVGIHPWQTDDSKHNIFDNIKKLVRMASDERVVAIGECGFDRLRGGSLECQAAIFGLHAKLAKRLGKPLIIHAVRSDDLLLRAARLYRPEPGKWIVHGFRGKPEAAKRLLDAGLSLSIGEKYNEDTLKLIPRDRLYRESDKMD